MERTSTLTTSTIITLLLWSIHIGIFRADSNNTTRYKITIYTGTKNYAGTNADVFIHIYGEDGHDCFQDTENDKEDNFEFGSTDRFMIECPRLGTLKWIQIGHDGSGTFPAWFLNKVIIKEMETGHDYSFPYYGWIGGSGYSLKVKINVNPLFATPDMKIVDVKPKAGPAAGGTLLTIFGSFHDQVQRVLIGDVPCTEKTFTEEEVICLTNPFPVSSPTGISAPLDIKLIDVNGKLIVGSYRYQYFPDPELFKMEPNKTIAMGGVDITVFGDHLATVETRAMVTTVTSLVTKETDAYRTSCVYKEDTSDRMFCPTPALNRTLFNGISINGQHADSAPMKYNFTMVLAFELDGVPDYVDLTGTTLEASSYLTIYADPVFYDISTSGNPVVFIPIWPKEDTLIEIKGSHLLDGLQEQDYNVAIGQEECQIIDIFNNKIVCEPPGRRPTVDEDVQHIGIPVKVCFGGHNVIVGYLHYQQTLWEYPPGRYAILSLCALITFIAAVTAGFCYLRRKRLVETATWGPQDVSWRQWFATELLSMIRLRVHLAPEHIAESSI